MKRLFFATICAAAMLTTSCEKSFEDVAAGGNEAATLSVNIGLPKMSTRVFADGKSATELRYAVYEQTESGLTKLEGAENEYEGTKDINLSTSISFTLLKNHTYGLVFWAAAPSEENGWESPYEVVFGDDGATVNVDYGAVNKANDDRIDAFYAYHEMEVTGDGSVSVKLYRPFAQINIGTNDYEKANALGINIAELQSYVEVPAASSLDLVTGDIDRGEGTVRFDLNDVPTTPEKYPVVGYDYLAMAYVLVDAEQETIDLTFGYSDGGDETKRTIGSVPVQRNYRTNIYGSLLTGNLDVNVEIEPDTDGDNNVMLTWDGHTTNEPALNDDTYTVKGADELAWLAEQEEDYEGKKIVLESDLDLAGHEFPAFASGAKRSGSGIADGSTSFKGEFNGNGKTIKNVKISNTSTDDGTIAGFFASVEGEDAAIKDVTFVDVEINGGEQAGVVGIVSDGATVEGVVVKSGKISSKKAAGGVVGRVLKNGTVKNCENNATVEANSNAGGIIGAAYYTDLTSEMTISGCDNYGNVTASTAGAGGIVGLNCGDVSDCNNYGTITGGTTSTGGIVGEQKSAGSVKGCTNYAEVKGGTGYGSAGIVGWVRYESSDAYSKLTPVEVSDCTNEGKHISGATGVGGIVGMWYCDGLCTRNTNLAETITASDRFVAGIVGGTQWGEICSNGTKSYGEEKLEVSYNTTYTADDNIKGALKDDFIYDNTMKAHTNIHDNKKTARISSAEDFQSAFANIQDGGGIIVLSDGEFDCKTVTWPKNGEAVTIKGNGEDSKLTNLGYVKTNDCDLTLENLNLFVEKGGSYTSMGFENVKSVTLKNVKVMGEFHTFSAENAVFEGCYFVHDGVNTADRQGVWCDCYGKTVIKDCVFEVVPPEIAGNETKAILIYSTTNFVMGDVEITNCTFKAGRESAKAAVEIHSEKFTSAGTITITGCTYDEATYKGGLWREIYNETSNGHTKGDKTSFYTVYVNGQLAQTAEDGNN